MTKNMIRVEYDENEYDVRAVNGAVIVFLIDHDGCGSEYGEGLERASISAIKHGPDWAAALIRAAGVPETDYQFELYTDPNSTCRQSTSENDERAMTILAARNRTVARRIVALLNSSAAN